MILERKKHLVAKTEQAIEKVSAIIGAIQGSEVCCKEHKGHIRGLYREWQDFVEAAVSFGMLLPLERERPTAPIKYWKTGMMPTIKIVEDVRTKPTAKADKKPVQGDGSCLKPRFNHAISAPIDNNKVKEINRLAPLGKSRLGLIGKIEDMGGYDQEAKLERLRMMRR